MRKIILASQSPRRRELLSQIGLSYEVRPSQGEEKIETQIPTDLVKELSCQKADDILEHLTGADTIGELLLIGADTIVVYDGKILGKPKNQEDAKATLRMLSEQTHSVYTGVTLALVSDGRLKEKIIFSEETKVFMYPMTEQEINWYVKSGEPMDKAGSYGIQGLGARFIRKIEGDYNNVVGLPIGRIYQELALRGVL